MDSHGYLATLLSSLTSALDFVGVQELHGAPGNPWRVPIVPGIKRAHGPIQSEVELLALMWAFVIMLKPKLIIETGSDTGIMTRALGLAAKANGFGEVVSAEVEPILVEHARKLCAGLPVTIHLGPALKLPIEQADLLFLDSSYESRLAELARVKPGAVAVVHDTCRKADLGAKVRAYPRHINVITPRGFVIVQK